MKQKRLACCLVFLCMVLVVAYGPVERASAAVFLDDTFEPAPQAGWTTNGYWHLVDDAADPCIGAVGHPASSHSPTHSFAYHIDASCDYDDGFQNWGELMAPTLDLSGTATAWLHFWTWFEDEGVNSYDTMWVRISPDGSTWTDLIDISNNGYSQTTWFLVDIDISAWTGDSSVFLSFAFDTGDEMYNYYAGWYVDDVLVDDVAPPLDTLTVLGSPMASGTVSQGQSNVVMEQLTLSASANDITVTAIQVDQTGSGVDSDVGAAYLYHDVDDNGALDTMVDTLLDTDWFFLGSLTFAPLSFTVVSGSPENLLVVFDISATAIPGNTLQTTLTDNTFISVSLPDTVSSTNFPLVSNTVTITGLTPLFNDVPVSGSAPVPDDFTFDVNSWDYAVVGVRPSVGDNFNLQTYIDTSFTTLIESSVSGGDTVDLVALDKATWASPPSRGARVDTGSANYEIEMENDYWDYLVTSSWTGSMDSTVDGIEVLDAYEVSDSAGTYTMTLDVPATADLDFFIFGFVTDNASNRGNPLASSELAGAGVDESMTFSIAAFTDYLLVITNENLGAGPGTGTYTINSNAPPEIVSTTPADGTPNVLLNQAVVITFSEAINTGTFTYTISPNPGGWSWSWSMGDTVATGTHSQFAASTTHTFTVTVADDLTGNPLSAGLIPNPWSWTTMNDVTSPTITATIPMNSATSASLSQSVVITFSEAINTGTFAYTISPDPGGWSWSWSMGDTAVTGTHALFAASTTHIFTVTAADDLTGNPLGSGTAPNPWSWTTGTTSDTDPPVIMATTPTNSQTNVPLNYPVVIIFNESINTVTFTYTIFPDPGGWGCNWNPSMTVVTCPHNPFATSTSYAFTVTNADDLSGNPLGAGPVPNPWSWTATSDVTPPNITATNPANSTTGVSLSQSVVITFSEQMNTTLFTYSCSPNPGGWTWTWSAGDTVVTGTHTDFAASTTYTFMVTLAMDAAWNPLVAGAVPNPWSWTTGTGGGGGGDTEDPEISNAKAQPQSLDPGNSVNITAKVTDNSGVDTVKVEIRDPNGNVIGTYTMTKGENDEYYYVFNIPSDATAGEYTFSIIATDASDNSATSSSKKFTVTASTTPPPSGRSFLEDYWWLLLVIVIVVVALVLMLILLMRRRKRPEDVAAPPPAPQTAPYYGPPQYYAPPQEPAPYSPPGQDVPPQAPPQNPYEQPPPQGPPPP